MAGILARGKVDAMSYEHQERMTCVILGVDAAVTAKPYPLLMAYDRDIYIDEVAFRASDTGDATTTAILVRSASGTAGDAGDNFSAAKTMSSVTDDTNATFALVEAEGTLARARVIPAGSTLFVDFTAETGTPDDYIFYIRWRTNPA